MVFHADIHSDELRGNLKGDCSLPCKRWYRLKGNNMAAAMKFYDSLKSWLAERKQDGDCGVLGLQGFAAQ